MTPIKASELKAACAIEAGDDLIQAKSTGPASPHVLQLLESQLRSQDMVQTVVEHGQIARYKAFLKEFDTFVRQFG